MAKPFAEISYGSVAISPSGSVGVRRLRVMPKFVNDSIMIGAIQLNFPNFLALLHARWQLSQNQLPEALSLSFQDVELSLSGGILGAATANAEKTRSPFGPSGLRWAAGQSLHLAPLSGGKWPHSVRRRYGNRLPH